MKKRTLAQYNSCGSIATLGSLGLGQSGSHASLSSLNSDGGALLAADAADAGADTGADVDDVDDVVAAPQAKRQHRHDHEEVLESYAPDQNEVMLDLSMLDRFDFVSEAVHQQPKVAGAREGDDGAAAAAASVKQPVQDEDEELRDVDLRDEEDDGEVDDEDDEDDGGDGAQLTGGDFAQARTAELEVVKSETAARRRAIPEPTAPSVGVPAPAPAPALTPELRGQDSRSSRSSRPSQEDDGTLLSPERLETPAEPTVAVAEVVRAESRDGRRRRRDSHGEASTDSEDSGSVSHLKHVVVRFSRRHPWLVAAFACVLLAVALLIRAGAVHVPPLPPMLPQRCQDMRQGGRPRPPPRGAEDDGGGQGGRRLRRRRRRALLQDVMEGEDSLRQREGSGRAGPPCEVLIRKHQDIMDMIGRVQNRKANLAFGAGGLFLSAVVFVLVDRRRQQRGERRRRRYGVAHGEDDLPEAREVELGDVDVRARTGSTSSFSQHEALLPPV